jgi:signal peptidase I
MKKFGCMLIGILLLVSVGCEEQMLTDPVTQPKLSTVKAEPGSLVLRARDDGMLGYDDYSREELVIDPNYYKTHALQRGDVVYIRYPDYRSDTNPNLKLGENGMLRVIALGGEKLEIRTGQVYINGKRLGAFYGLPPGPGLEELKNQESSASGSSLADYEKENLRNRIRTYETNYLKSLNVPKDSVFLLGDNRWRAADSELFGPLPAERIIGKVIGIMDKHDWEISPTFAITFTQGSPDANDYLPLRGEKRRLAIVDQTIVAGKPYQNYWFFWGTPEELAGSPEIIAVQQNNETNRRVVFAAGGVSGPLSGAHGHIPPSNMTISTPGIWRLEAYIGGKYFGSIVVAVKQD